MSLDTEPTPRPELPMRLTRLRVKNFRSIADIDIPLSPLTVLVGPNGSGKSNVVDALRFVRDVFARGLDQAIKERGGINLLKRWGDNINLLSIGVSTYWPQINRIDEFSSPTEKHLIPVSIPAATVSYDFEIECHDKGLLSIKSETLIVEIPGNEKGKVKLVRQGNSFTLSFDNHTKMNVSHQGISDSSAAQMLSKHVGLWLPGGLMERAKSHKYGMAELEQQNWFLWFLYKSHNFQEVILKHLFYNLSVLDLRSPQTIVEESPFDEEGRNLAAVLRFLSINESVDWKNLQLVLRQAISGFNTLEVEKIGGYLATKLIYQTATTQPRTSYLGQESDGTIRMLGILAALYQEPAQPFLSIEEPEANIHPGALAVLASALDEASLRSQILLTTHSPDMLNHLPAESFLVVEKVGDTTHVGPLDAGQRDSVRKRLFTPGELLRMEGLQRQATPDSAA